MQFENATTAHRWPSALGARLAMVDGRPSASDSSGAPVVPDVARSAS